MARAAHACRNPLALLLLSTLAACGGGGGGGDVCNDPDNAAREGLWAISVASTTTTSGAYVNCGLDGNVLELDLLAVQPIEGGNGCAAVYRLAAPGLDFSSPSFPGEPLAMTAVAVDSMPEGAFWLGGFYFFAGSNITVYLDVDPATAIVSDGDPRAFALEVRYELYEGRALIAVPYDEPGVDDDGDGEIDEPGEFELVDEIDPTAIQVAAGQMILNLRG